MPCTAHIASALSWTYSTRYSVDDLYLHVRGQLCSCAESTCTWIIIIVGMQVYGRGYDGQLKYTICDVCRPCHSILSILKPVYRQLRPTRCTLQIDQGPRCWDLVILVVTTTTDRQTDQLLYPCACVRGNYNVQCTCMHSQYRIMYYSV